MISWKMMKTKNKKKKAVLLFLLLLLIPGLLWINKDLHHFESVHLIGRSFTNETDSAGIYRLVQTETLKKGTYTIEFVVKSPSENEQWLLLTEDDIIAEGSFDGTVRYEVEKSSEQIAAGVYYGGDKTDFEVLEINYYSENVLTRQSLFYHFSLSSILIIIILLLILRFVYTELYERTLGRILTPSRERIVLFLLVLTIFICIPYYRPEYVKADDSTYHMARIEGLKTTLEQGIFPARIYLFYLNGYGYPGGIFYPDIMLYFPAILRILGFDFILTYKIYIFVLNFLNLASVYLCVSRITEKRLPGITAAVLFGFNSYRLIDVFYRGAIGEIQAFIFIPMIVLGLYYMFTGKTKHWPVFALGFTGLILSHLISTVLCTIMLSLFFLINLRKIIRTKDLFGGLIKSVILTVGLSACFIFPLLEQLTTNEVLTSNLRSAGIPFYALFANRVIWTPPVKPYPGYPLLFGVFVFLISANRQSYIRKTIIYTALFSMLGFFCSTSLFPWDCFTWLNRNIQFPWRFFIISIPLLVIAESTAWEGAFSKKEQWILLVILTLFCMISVIPIYQSTFTSRWMESRGYKMENNRVGSNMYLPVGFDPEFIDKNRDTVLSSDPDFIMDFHKRGNLSFTFGFVTDQDKVDFEIPLLYYTGYEAILSADTGEQKLDISRGIHGMISASVNNVSQGTIRVKYVKTPVQHLSDIISLTTVLILILQTCVRRKILVYAAK